MRPSYLHNGNPYTGKTTFSYHKLRRIPGAEATLFRRTYQCHEWLLVPWLLMSPGHQQFTSSNGNDHAGQTDPCHSSIKNHFKCLRHFNDEKLLKMRIYAFVFFSEMNSGRQVLSITQNHAAMGHCFSLKSIWILIIDVAKREQSNTFSINNTQIKYCVMFSCTILIAKPRVWCHRYHIDGLVHDCSIFSASALEILRSCTEPSI